MPPCSRVNCLHDKETDPEKREGCNAYLDHNLGSSTQLMLYKDAIYITYARNDTTPETPFLYVMYRISLDGSNKDEIYRTAVIQDPIIHRGYMYYFTQEYQVKEGQTIGSISSVAELHRLNIDGSKIKEEVLLSSDKYTGMEAIKAYGNHIYVRLIVNNSSMQPLVYDISTEKFEETEMRFSYTFCNGQLYSTEFDLSEEGPDEGEIYASDYKYQEHQVVLEHIPRFNYVTSDIKYLYENNSYSCFEDPETVIQFKV